EETWVAFARDRKGYKRWTHYRIAVSRVGVRVTVFVEDDADDKARFGANLEASAAKILKSLGSRAPIRWYTLGDVEPALHHEQLRTEDLAKAGADLQRLKTLKFQ